MAGLQYTHPDDDYLPPLVGQSPAAITTTATPLDEYGVENIANDNPSLPFKTDDLTFDVVIDLGEPKDIGLITIGHANFDEGLPLIVEVDDNPSFTSPETLDFEGPAYQEDKFPTNIELDFVELGFGVKTYRYIRIRNAVTSPASPNSVGISIGIISVFAAWRDLGVDFQADGNAEDDEDHPGIRNATDSGNSTKYPFGNRDQWLRGNVLDTNVEDDEKVRRWNRAARGDFRRFWVNPDLPIKEPWFVEFDGSRLPRRRLFRDLERDTIIHGYALAFVAVGRGLIPEPSAV